MLPPSHSLLHQLHKLAEARASPQNQARPSPPPPYSIRIPLDVSNEDTRNEIFEHGRASEELDEDDDSVSWESGPSSSSYRSESPITIHIDASISILGNNNTVIIPSAIAPPRDNNPEAPAPQTSPVTLLYSAQRHRQARLTDMATSIITALGKTGILDRTGSGATPVAVNIDTGIKVEGSRNVICAGPGLSSTRLLGKRRLNQTNGEANLQDGNRKRRALSEPFEIPPKPE
ncbi:hypothetical protein BDV25DRAFT_169977 [Aspergillus avenaceus]|uniref:Uncharacterized protein n=1 Tax=Aspergillus avenaceus TaxID=36643 RepID=A0A5N6TJH2_ASPAV|nr:hypothetical protein BDV25DRAFT_169977 [Aspergillus avenaceus]